jgi:uncharacterized protein with ParB-like and HNH nuclease domain
MSIVNNMDTESRPIKWVFDEFKKGNLFVDESFQRNYIWIRKDRISLLETIILGYPIPEIYLWETGTDPNSGDTKYSIIDGQQRIRTIGNFIDNDLKLTASGLEFDDGSYKDKHFDDLAPHLRSGMWAYKISIRFVKQAVVRDDIVKMFLRLNRTSNALNPQELRNAEFNGKFLKASEAAANLEFWKKWNLFSEHEIRRMQDIQFASTLLIFVRSGFEDETTQSAINRMYDMYSDEYPDQANDIAYIEAALYLLDLVLMNAPNIADTLKKKTHLYSIFTLFVALMQGNVDEPLLAKELSDWFQWTEGIIDPPEEWAEPVSEYRRLSQEGVQKKSNRLRRYEILSEFVTHALTGLDPRSA